MSLKVLLKRLNGGDEGIDVCSDIWKFFRELVYFVTLNVVFDILTIDDFGDKDELIGVFRLHLAGKHDLQPANIHCFLLVAVLNLIFSDTSVSFRDDGN